MMIMSYITVSDVKNALNFDTSTITDTIIQEAIEWSEDEVDRWTFTTYYPPEDSGIVTSFTTTTLSDTDKDWEVNQWTGYMVYIYSGTGSNQFFEIKSNTATQLTITTTWKVNLDTTSKYFITYKNYIEELHDATNTNSLILLKKPVVKIEYLKIGDTEISTDHIWLYGNSGLIVLTPDAEKHYFAPTGSNYPNQCIEVHYHYGVLPEETRGKLTLPGTIKRFTTIIAALKCVTYWLGGSYTSISNFSMPDFSATNAPISEVAKKSIETLLQEVEYLKKEYVGRYSYLG